MTDDWSRRRVVGVFVAVVVLFFWRPLTGLGVLLPNDLLDAAAPWSATRGGTRPDNPWLSDTITLHVHFAGLGDAIRSGHGSWWDRGVIGGIPVLKSGFSPLLFPYLLVPASYAPGLVAALRTLVAGGLMAGFLRRGLGTDRVAALVGALAYGFTGYLIGWLAWPQSNVAAFAPGLLWATEMLVRDPRARRLAPIAVVVAALVVSNFPLATAYLLLAAGLYAVWRLTGRVRRDVISRRAVMAVIGWGTAGVLTAALLASLYLSEFTTYFDAADTAARSGLPADSSTGARFLLTLVHPWAFGAADHDPAFWADGTNWIEAQGHLGASVVVLAFLSLLVQRDRDDERRSAVGALWLIAVLGAWISYVGGPLTEAVQSLPLLGANSVGRSRVLTHVAAAGLAGLGVQAWIDTGRGLRVIEFRGFVRRVGPFMLLGAVLFTPLLIDWGREARARGFLDDAVVDAWLSVAAAAAVVALLWLGTRRADRRGLATMLLVGVVAIELAGGARSVTTVVDRSRAGYHTPEHDAVLDLLGPGERLGGDGRTFWANTGQLAGQDDVRGQVLYPAGWRRALQTVQSDAFGPPGTSTNPWFDERADLGAAALDTLAVRVWAEAPTLPVRGRLVERPVAFGTVDPGLEMIESDIEVPTGGVRGVVFEVSQRAAAGTLRVTVEQGAQQLSVERAFRTLPETGDVAIALAGERLAAGPATLRLTADASIALGAAGEGPATGLVLPADDGLTLVRAGAVTLYEREGAAAAWFVPDVEPDVLDPFVHGPAAPDARPVTVTVADGGTVELAFDAPSAGTLVVSQAPHPGWQATVDGQAADVVAVAGTVSGVRIEDPGSHEARLHYTPRRLGLWLLLMGLGTVIVAASWWWDRPRRDQGSIASR